MFIVQIVLYQVKVFMGTYFNKEDPASERRQKLRSQMIHPEDKPSKKLFPPGEGNMKKKNVFVHLTTHVSSAVASLTPERWLKC